MDLFQSREARTIFHSISKHTLMLYKPVSITTPVRMITFQSVTWKKEKGEKEEENEICLHF